MGNTASTITEDDIRQKTASNINETIKSIGNEGKTPTYSKQITFTLNNGDSHSRESYLINNLNAFSECTKETIERVKQLAVKADAKWGEYHFDYDFSQRILLGVGYYCVTYEQRIYSIVVRSYPS